MQLYLGTVLGMKLHTQLQIILGSLDINRGDTLLGWDTDQFPNSVAELILPFYHIFSNGGIGKGGLNFDAKFGKIVDPKLFYAHIGGMDICAELGSSRKNDQ